MPILDASTAQLVDRLEFVSRMLQRASDAGQRGRPLATVYRDVRCALRAVLLLHLREPFDPREKPGASQVHRLLDRSCKAGARLLQ